MQSNEDLFDYYSEMSTPHLQEVLAECKDIASDSSVPKRYRDKMEERVAFIEQELRGRGHVV